MGHCLSDSYACLLIFQNSLLRGPFSTFEILLNLLLLHVPSILPPMRGRGDCHTVFPELLVEASRRLIFGREVQTDLRALLR